MRKYRRRCFYLFIRYRFIFCILKETTYIKILRQAIFARILISPYIIDIYINKKIEADALWQALLTVNFWTGKAPSVDFWYISVILAFYLLYPLIHKFIFHDRLFFKKREPLLSSSACEFIRMLILVVLSVGLAVFLFYVFSDAYKTVDRAVSRLTIFIFGCYIGKFVKEKKRFSFVFSPLNSNFAARNKILIR